MSYDNVCKILAEKYPTDFARWLLAVEPRTIEVLKTELIPIRVLKRDLDFDSILKTELLKTFQFYGLDCSLV